MKKYLLKRLIYIVVVFFIVSLMMYAIYSLIPGDPAMIQMEPLRKTLKPDVFQAQYRALREELSLDDPIIVRYAKWMGFAKRRGEEFNFTESNKVKSGKRYLVAYTEGDDIYVIGNSLVGMLDNTDKLPIMAPVKIDGDRKLEINSTIPDKYGRDIKKNLLTVEGSVKNNWTIKNTAGNQYLVLDDTGAPIYVSKIEDSNYALWKFDENLNIVNVNWTGENKYLAFGTAEAAVATDNYLTLTNAPHNGFKLYPINDYRFNGMLQGNFGKSLLHKDFVVNVIGTPMLNSVILNLAAELLALAVTIPLGIYCAVHARKPLDTTIQAVTLVGHSMPSFITAILFIFVFAVTFRWFPVTGAATPGSTFTGAREFADRMYYMCLPILTVLFMSLAGQTRFIRAAMLDTLTQDYIRTARAKGLKEKVVIYSHAWRNALLPISTNIIGSFIGIFLGGMLVIENTFALNGLGKLYFDALMAQDFELVLALQMFWELISLFGVLLTDVTYTLIDPRVRISK